MIHLQSICADSPDHPPTCSISTRFAPPSFQPRVPEPEPTPDGLPKMLLKKDELVCEALDEP